jgi:hypothetical protein
MNARSMSGAIAGDFPASGSSRQKLAFALKYAAMAPTENGWQPWYFRLADTYLELMTKNNPAQESADPERREFMIGCGSALLYLKLALKHFNCLGQVALFPDLGQPALVARVHFGFSGERGAQEKVLFEAMPGSRANGSPLGETPISETMLAVLGHAAAGERGWLDFIQSETSWQQVQKFTLADGQRWTNLKLSLARLSLAFGGRNIHSWHGAVEPVRQPAVSVVTLAVAENQDGRQTRLVGGRTDDGPDGFAGTGVGLTVGVLQSSAPP